jgi:hypothetical protein
LFKEQAPFFFRRLPISADVVPADMQADLVRLMKEMPLKPFGFHGYEGKRRVVSFGGKVGAFIAGRTGLDEIDYIKECEVAEAPITR